MTTRIKSGCVFFFSSKNIVSNAQNKQNTEDTIKKRVFFNETNFLKAAKFHRNNTFKEKKTYPKLTKVLIKKFEFGRTYSVKENRGKLHFLFKN